MLYQHQTKMGWPEGNCLQTCIANLLECPPDDLPPMVDEIHWRKTLNDWLQENYGLIYLEVPFTDEAVGTWWADSVVLGLGPSDIPEAPGHCTLVRIAVVDGDWVVENVHDPLPGGNGLPHIDAVGVLVRQFKQPGTPVVK